MEWVETTAKTIEAAKDLALDRLGVAADDAEFEVLEEPRAGLFGRIRGEARVRARVRPTQARPKVDRRRDRRTGKGKGADAERGATSDTESAGTESSGTESAGTDEREPVGAAASVTARGGRQGGSDRGDANRRRGARSPKVSESDTRKESNVEQSDVTPQQVGEAAVEFMAGLASAFGTDAAPELSVDGDELEVRVDGADLGLLIGPGGRTLTAVQDLARVAAQRRLGDHQTRLRIDVAGYREKRRVALEKFALAVAAEVVASGQAKALEPMQSADRKVVHDAIGALDGVVSRSDGEDPDRRVIIAPA